MNYYKHKGKDNYYIVHDTKHKALMFLNTSGMHGFNFKNVPDVVNMAKQEAWERQGFKDLDNKIKGFEHKLELFDQKVKAKVLLLD